MDRIYVIAITIVIIFFGYLGFESFKIVTTNNSVETSYNSAIKYCNTQENSEDKNTCRRQVGVFYSVLLKEQENGK